MSLPGADQGGGGAKTATRSYRTPLAREQLHFFFIIKWARPGNGIGAGGRQREPLRGLWRGAGRPVRGGPTFHPRLWPVPAISDLATGAETQGAGEGGQDAFKSAAGPRGASHRPYLGRQAITACGREPNRPILRRADAKSLKSFGKHSINFIQEGEECGVILASGHISGKLSGNINHLGGCESWSDSGAGSITGLCIGRFSRRLAFFCRFPIPLSS
jgi:hypothetical protein